MIHEPSSEQSTWLFSVNRKMFFWVTGSGFCGAFRPSTGRLSYPRFLISVGVTAYNPDPFIQKNNSFTNQ
jgi:hypothetical protein